MKARQLTYAALYLSCTLAVLTACTSNEDPLTPKEKTPVGINPTITGEVVTKTDANYEPADGAKKIYMYYKDGDNTKEQEKGIYAYGSGWATDTDGELYWDDLNAVDGAYAFWAVSPNDLSNGATGAVETDQSATNNLTNSDLLMAYTANVTKQNAVALTFKHMLSKLTVKVKVGDVNGFSASAVSIKNAIKDYTVTYGSPSAETPATVAKATSEDISATAITPKSEDDGTYGSNKKMKVYSAILPMQTIGDGADEANIEIKITVGSANPKTENTYTYKPSSGSKITLAQGKHTILTLTISGTKVELGEVKVTNWTSEEKTGDIEIDTPAAP